MVMPRYDEKNIPFTFDFYRYIKTASEFKKKKIADVHLHRTRSPIKFARNYEPVVFFKKIIIVNLLNHSTSLLATTWRYFESKHSTPECLSGARILRKRSDDYGLFCRLFLYRIRNIFRWQRIFCILK